MLKETVYNKKRICYCSVLWKVKILFAVMLLLRKVESKTSFKNFIDLLPLLGFVHLFVIFLDSTKAAI